MAAAAALLAAAALAVASFGTAAAETPRADPASYRVETLASGLDRPWSLAHLPDGRRLVTERPGRLRVVEADGRLRPEPLAGLPDLSGEVGPGLMDVAIDPSFAETGLLFLTWSYGTKEANNTRLARAYLRGDRLEDLRILFSATPKAGTSNYGGRIAILPDRTLLLTLGDGFDRREEAQNPANHLGKLVRLAPDGGVPADNPFVDRAGTAPEILSLGHRNVQGVAVDPADGAVLVAEHGARGGDELNRILPGRNYGWPIVTGGIDYSFARVTPYRDLPGFERPLLEWTPSIAPSAMAVYRGAAFPGWRGDLLVAALRERSLRRIRREDGRIVGQELLLTELDQRLRDVRVAPDGAVEVLTDGPDAKLLRITPR